MNAFWRTIRSYILWQHERGTLHYDVMVTLIPHLHLRHALLD